MVKIFNYIEELDCFVFTEEFKTISNELNIVEWHEGVWIGRLFFLDNDVGEHFFDNWNEREEIEKKAEKFGLDINQLMIVVPERFYIKREPPSHTHEHRKLFWTDVFKSLQLSLETIFEEARAQSEVSKNLDGKENQIDIERKIETIKSKYE